MSESTARGHYLPAVLHLSEQAVTEQPYYSLTRNRHYRGCQDNQPWFTEPQIGLHLELEALAMRLSRCCVSQPITGEIEEKDDIIGKLGQLQRQFWLSCSPAYEFRDSGFTTCKCLVDLSQNSRCRGTNKQTKWMLVNIKMKKKKHTVIMLICH